MKTYINVRELNAEQLDQLRWDYFYNLSEKEQAENGFVWYMDIPDFILYEVYDGISFVQEDFGIEED